MARNYRPIRLLFAEENSRAARTPAWAQKNAGEIGRLSLCCGDRCELTAEESAFYGNGHTRRDKDWSVGDSLPSLIPAEGKDPGPLRCHLRARRPRRSEGAHRAQPRRLREDDLSESASRASSP